MTSMLTTFIFVLAACIVSGTIGIAIGRVQGSIRERKRTLRMVMEKAMPGTEKLIRKLNPNLVKGMDDPRHPLEMVALLHEVNGRQGAIVDILDAITPGGAADLIKSRDEAAKIIRRDMQNFIKHK